jgi:hypothetical protein
MLFMLTLDRPLAQNKRHVGKHKIGWPVDILGMREMTVNVVAGLEHDGIKMHLKR